MRRIQGLTWEPTKANGAFATKNEKLAGALINWYYEHVNDFRCFNEMILDQSHVEALEIFGCVEEFSEDIGKILSIIHIDGGVLLRRHLAA